jgi:hypothetical protein
MMTYDPHAVTAAYLLWKRQGSKGVWCRRCDMVAGEGHQHATEVLDPIPIGLGGNKVDVAIKREEDAVKCQHAVFWPGCAA